VSWKDVANRSLSRTTGFELRRAQPPDALNRRAPARPGNRLLPEPNFVMCTLRSGSTLLRMMLNSHPEIHCPHEIHLRYVSVSLDEREAKRSMKEMGLNQERLEYLLWDRILHRELARSGKPLLVTKTPNDVYIADRIKKCWPKSKMVFLIRHPAMIARSRLLARPGRDEARNIEIVRNYCNALERARQSYDGPTIHYEDLTTDPVTTLTTVCDHLGVQFDPLMLEYGRQDHGRAVAGLGDWKDKIKTGAVQPHDPLPSNDEIPEPLRDICATWGYLA
jgi:hypothetical protein